ncbi:MAG: NAD(P)(+) transhydrogenase (Re/Si-specific) subunit beta, partial [Amphiplicatus sp.]
MEITTGMSAPPIGTITFSGSIIAFLKLNGNMSGKPIILPARHIINIALAAAIVIFIGMLLTGEQSNTTFLLLTLAAFILGFLLIVPIG